MNDLVSILIPAYNAGRWIAEAIGSALGQTWPHVEVIVVDDGSSDRTLEIARRFESKRVAVVTQSNGGATAARNRAFELAQGSFIQWLDADDILHPEKVARQMKVALEHGDPKLLLSGPHGTFYYRVERAAFVRNALWRDVTPIEYFLAKFGDNAWIQTAAWLVSRKLTEGAGPWPDTRAPNDDGEYFCRVVTKSSGIKFVQDARTYYRTGNYGSLGYASSDVALAARFRSMEVTIGYLLTLEDSARTRAAAVQLLQSWYPAFSVPAATAVAEQSRQLARKLGSELTRPIVKWKYRPIQWFFGYQSAVRASLVLPGVKARAKRRWDQMCYERSRSSATKDRTDQQWLGRDNPRVSASVDDA